MDTEKVIREGGRTGTPKGDFFSQSKLSSVADVKENIKGCRKILIHL